MFGIRKRVVCSWCDASATHNLDTTHDQACAAHFAQWFTASVTAEVDW